MTERLSLLPRKAALAMALFGGAMAMLGGAKASAQQSSDNCVSRACEIDVIANNVATQNELNSIYNEAYKKGWDSVMNAKANQKPIPENAYMKQAQALFATNPDGSYKNSRIGQIVDNTIRFYSANSYGDLSRYYDTLKTEPERNVVFTVLDIMANGGFKQQDKKERIKSDYADFLSFVGGPSISQYYIQLLPTAKPSGVPAKEKFRTLAGVLVHVPYVQGTQTGRVAQIPEAE